MGKNVTFTGEVKTKQMSFLIGEKNDELHTAYYVFLRTADGQEVTVKDPQSPVGMMEAPTRHKAVKKGKEFLVQHQGDGVKP